MVRTGWVWLAAALAAAAALYDWADTPEAGAVGRLIVEDMGVRS